MGKQILEKLRGDLSGYTSIPFWSWNNLLSKDELLRQIDEFEEQGIYGFIMHARTGFKTEYLSDEWFELVGEWLKQADERNLKAWVYDENGWPSGFAGGELLHDKENLAQYLVYEKKDFFDESADAVYSIQSGAAKRITPCEKTDTYHCIYIKSHGSYADILNPEVVSKFINLTYEPYYERFSDYFGKAFVGFFTDEPQYFRWNTAYSRVLPSEFKKEYGEDIFDGLIYLFVDCGDLSKQFRYKNFSLLSKLYVENFYKKIYDWCQSRNCMLTGHTIEENSLSGQMWSCAGAMPSYEYQHAPGIDWLGRTIGTPISPKQIGSVAAQLSKKQVLTETFGCSGWDTTPRELRWITENQYVNGVNTMCQHLVSYSLKGQAKGDHPPSFSRHNPWIKHSRQFNEYFLRLSCFLCNTKEAANTLVIHPIRSAYLTYQREEDAKSIRQLEDHLRELTLLLTGNHIQFHFGDETLLKKYARTEGGKIQVGDCSYDHVIVPDMQNIEEFTYSLILEFMKSGGKAAVLGNSYKFLSGKPFEFSIPSNIGIDSIAKDFEITEFDNSRPSKLMVSRRFDGESQYLYIFNSSKDSPAEFESGQGFSVLDLQSLSVKQAKNPVTLRPMESTILILDKDKPAEKAIKKESIKDITSDFEVGSLSKNLLNIDYVSVSFDGVNYGGKEFVHLANERLIKQEYKGKVWLKYEFFAKYAPENLTVLFEELEYISAAFNGVNIDILQADLDVFFKKADLSGLAKQGVNELEFCINYFQSDKVKPTLYDPEVFESEKNCLVIDTEIDSVYIIGDFFVKERNIVKPSKIEGINKLQNKGLENFAGSVVYEGTIDTGLSFDGNAALRLSGRYMTAKITCNGKERLLMLSDTCDISGILKSGKNSVEIEMVSSLRNLLGPHHWAFEAEPESVGHLSFEFRGTWTDGVSEYFTKSYNLVDFGLEKIELILQK